jgi:hypothetical protein
MDLPFSTSKKDQLVKIRQGDGMAGLEPLTISQSFSNIIKKYGDKPALHQKILKPGMSAADIPWTTWTWREYKANVDKFAKALL